ncbi:conserved hypothetical protein [Ricinus communis]|uniref:Uncharacterized protein n=1 Tax=Ricinus communis TaxID=3988 RepID=B9RFC8_RICCO|nr:conserved hypothetical protein [Ricinus communis]
MANAVEERGETHVGEVEHVQFGEGKKGIARALLLQQELLTHYIAMHEHDPSSP